jgi:metal-responsive CopG/Arc/MetJ family transcriptional regulator
MKVKTSVTLDKELLEAIKKLLGKYRDRSEFIEAAVEAYIEQVTRYERDDQDAEIINRHADDLNKEALDVLDYQGAW